VPSTARPGLPLVAEPATDQGDPFLLEVPAAERADHRYRYYVYVTGTGFPVYGSDDLLDPAGWRRVGDSFPDLSAEHWCWAPCVRYVPGLARPWVMLYSKAAGTGELLGHQGHRILRADSTSPAGPFRDSGEVLTADLDFAIDPDVRVASDGTSRLLFATDFVEDEPYGTGIVEARISRDLRALESAPAVLARPRADWQLYEANRSMPWKQIPGVRWDRSETVRWSTVEGPAALESPGGQPVVLYSGGNYAGFYGIGVLASRPDGQWLDLSPRPEDCLLAPRPGLFGPGHCSALTSDGQSVLCYHFRNQPDAPRQFGILPLSWHPDTDLPYLPG
jgi:arabinan endo-1,5-alpha-L-arabinosidase